MYSKKQELDKFYTKENIVKICLENINFNEYDFVIEPSAGNGKFYHNIDHSNKLGIDIEPDHNDIYPHDWLTYEIPSKYKNVLIIGNPPFGKRNKLSINFIKHSCSFSNVKTIAFILPDVYHKHTLQKNISSDFRLKEIIKLPKNSFLIGEEEYHVPCSFFVFDKSSGPCLRFNPENYQETADWCYGTKDDYDFFVMGAAANVIKDCPEKNNRGYYIKSKIDLDIVKENFTKGNWKGYSCANGGVYWLTKPELVKLYIEQFNKDYLA